VLKSQLATLKFKVGDNVQEFCKRYLSLVEELGYETSGQRAVEDFIGTLDDFNLRLQLASQAKSQTRWNLFDATRVLKQLVSMSMGSATADSGTTAKLAFDSPAISYGKTAAANTSSPSASTASSAKAEAGNVVDLLAQKFDKLTLTMQDNQRQLINILLDRHGCHECDLHPWCAV
jgi:hypothetical protein